MHEVEFNHFPFRQDIFVEHISSLSTGENELFNSNGILYIQGWFIHFVFLCGNHYYVNEMESIYKIRVRTAEKLLFTS